tara:strand:- start:147 stop:1004 length:858 start_codon:yes stop_codon:yes gene_type:complete
MEKKLNQYLTYRLFRNSKKSSLKWSSYFQVYENIFSKYRNKNITFVEIGVFNGGSLFIWKKLFGKKAKIIGIDANPNAKKMEKYGFKIYIGNQSDSKFWKNFFKKEGKVDIVLDDGAHKNLHQISTVHYCLPHIKDGGKIVVEDTATSYLKKEFNNPSKYSFINFCNLIIEIIHKRSGLINKNLNIYAKKIYSINFFESIVVFSIDSKKCFKSSEVYNKAKNEWEVDYRHNDYFEKTRDFITKKYSFLNNINIFRKLIRKLFYRNFLINFYENHKIRKIFKNIKK